MAEISKIKYYDLRLEAEKGRLPVSVGRQAEFQRLTRIVSRQVNNNALLVAPSGAGKTAFLKGWAGHISRHPFFREIHLLELEASSLHKINSVNADALKFYQEALSQLPECVVVIDNFGQLIYNQSATLPHWLMLLRPLLEKRSTRVVLTLLPKELEWLETQSQSFLSGFEILKLPGQTPEELNDILLSASGGLHKKTSIKIPGEIIEEILNYTRKFPSLGQNPKAGIWLLDECVADAIAKKRVVVEKSGLENIVSEKLGIPLSQLTADEKNKLKDLESVLNQNIIGQKTALAKITSVIQRAKLGLKSSSRPLGSFLLLGPSGVGKTETAKVLAERLFGKKDSFLRIDMSEFSESHAIARLIGSPPGYVGFDAGGQLSNHLKNNPYSLVLLDEIEKAHPKIFDIFLQILDDGRLTSGQGETVDATQSVFMATSNLGVDQILDRFTQRRDIYSADFLKTELTPVLLNHFRMEFLNRFDSLIIYKPLDAEDLVQIALLEISKIEMRVKKHNIKFAISPQILRQKVAQLSDPRFGARPIKRFIEEVCESLIAKQLLK